MLNEPRKILAVAPSSWTVAEVPTNPLSTFTTLKLPVPEIGPTDVVPRPTLSTFIYSSSTLKISPGKIEEIPEIEKKDVRPVIDPPLSSKS